MHYYFQVFYEAIWAASIVPFASEATFLSLKFFGGYNMLLAALLAITGATIGQMFNWWLGTRLLYVHRKGKSHLSDHHYIRAAALFQRYGIFLLLLSWMPLLKLVLLFAGFLGTRFRLALPLVVLGQIYNYGHYLW